MRNSKDGNKDESYKINKSEDDFSLINLEGEARVGASPQKVLNTEDKKVSASMIQSV